MKVLKKEEEGITLVALIITIVVLLILAGVAIGVAKDSDIIGYSKNAAESYKEARGNELDMLANYEQTLDNYVPKNNGDIQYFNLINEVDKRESVYALIEKDGNYELKGYTGELGGQLVLIGKSNIYLKKVESATTIGEEGNEVIIKAGSFAIASEQDGEAVAYLQDETLIINGEEPTIMTKVNADIASRLSEGEQDDDDSGNEGESVETKFANFRSNPDAFTHASQSSTNKDRAVGTDGTAVNMDDWRYVIISDTTKEVALTYGRVGCSYGPSYVGAYTADGEIEGTVPQYMKINGKDGIYTVTSMYESFGYEENLKIAPAIPNTVTNLSRCFLDCENLEVSPQIPSGITDLSRTFSGCKKLVSAPTIPEGVTNIDSTFAKCIKITSIPEIPSSVTKADTTFNKCESFSGTIVIKATGIGEYNCKYWSFGTNNVTIKVPNGSTTHASIQANYGSSSNITIEPY